MQKPTIRLLTQALQALSGVDDLISALTKIRQFDPKTAEDDYQIINTLAGLRAGLDAAIFKGLLEPYLNARAVKTDDAKQVF